MTPKDIRSYNLWNLNVTYFGKKVFAEIKLKILKRGRSSWIIWVVPKYHQKCPYKRERQREMR